MKKIILASFAVLFIIISCSDDKNVDSPTVPPVTILSILSTSKAKYETAANGDWIEITATEYNKLTTDLKETSKVGLKDEHYPKFSDLKSGNYNRVSAVVGTRTYSNKIPTNAYVIAFKYSPTQATISNKNNVKINSSNNPKDEYSNLGSTLPAHTGGEEVFFVLKGNTIKNTSKGYLAAYLEGYPGWSHKGTNYHKYSNSNLITTYRQAMIVYQGIATTKKQW